MTEALLPTTSAECISGYRRNVVLTNASLSQDDDRTFKRVKSQHSLVVHWHWSNTVTVQTPLISNEMRMDNCVAFNWQWPVIVQWSSTGCAH